MSNPRHIPLYRLLTLHTMHGTIKPSEGIWLVPHMYAEGIYSA